MTPTHTCAIALHPLYVRQPDGSLTESMDLDSNFLFAITQRVVYRHMLQATEVAVFPAERDRHGVTEWMIVVTYTSGSKLTIGALQRKPGGEIEFNS